MTPRLRTLILPVLIAGGALVGAPDALAQDRPVVFVHGLNSDGNTWQAAADRLQQHLAIAAHLPTLRGPSYGDQANELQGQFWWLPGTTIAVGHSNGGIVSRHWSGLHDVAGVLTLSTPHRGAPVFAHVADWINFNLMAFDLIGAVGGAFGTTYDDSWWVYTAVQGVLSLATQGAQDAILQLSGLLALHRWLPIFPEMIPGSGYLSALNSSGNLGREANAIPSRVGIVNVAHNFYRGGVFRALWPNQGDAIADVIHASAAVLDYYAMVLWGSPYPRDWQRAQKLSTVAWWLWVHEDIWCRTISDPSPAAYSSAGFCAENDTLVPTWSQVYPNATNIEKRNTPAHRKQTKHMDAALYEALVTFMPVYPRGATPPQNPPGPPPPPSGAPDSLYAGQWLGMQQELRSGNDRYSLFYQGDGNLVLYRADGKPLWASQTAGTAPGQAVMQGDGNFVIYDAHGTPMWHTGTNGHPGSVLALQDDGNLVIYNASGVPIWTSGTAGW
jgi:hypothetical protein